MPTPAPWGSEFLVNTTTTSDQRSPVITTLSNGRFVVAWQDLSADGGDIRAQMFLADGTKFGSEILVNTETTNVQHQPAITALPAGGFVVGWTDNSPLQFGTGGAIVKVQAFNASGVKVGSETPVPAEAEGVQQQLTLLSTNTGFLAAWLDEGGDDPGVENLRGRFFNSAASPASSELPLNATTLNLQSDPSMARLSNGNIVVTFTDNSQSLGDASGVSVHGRIFTSAGAPIAGEFLINETTAFDQTESYVAALSGGGFVAAWRDLSTDLGDVRARVFNNAGTEVVSEFVVNTVAAGIHAAPAIAGLPDGRFVIAFFANDNGTNADIHAQVFLANGARDGDEFIVQTDMTNSQDSPSITVLADGRFVISWFDRSPALGDIGGGVHARIFDPRPSGGTQTGTSGTDVLAGTVFSDTLFGFGGNDRLAGDSAADTLNGGTGIDVMTGGNGNDTYHVDNASDVTTETNATLASGGNDLVVSSVTRTLGANLERLTLTGTSAIDGTGNALNNVIFGNGAANTLRGEAGADILNGLGGADIMIGGDSNDTYYVDNALDLTTEANATVATGGNDLVISTVTRTLGANLERLTLTGTSAINGTGNALNNTITGNGAANILNGGLGNDTLTGGAGPDTFVFNSLPNTASNRDLITGFSSLDDIIHLDNAVFATLGAAGAIGGRFWSSATGLAHDADDRIIYNTANGVLTYDSNGNVAGGSVIQFAILLGKPAINATDFLVV